MNAASSLFYVLRAPAKVLFAGLAGRDVYAWERMVCALCACLSACVCTLACRGSSSALYVRRA